MSDAGWTGCRMPLLLMPRCEDAFGPVNGRAVKLPLVRGVPNPARETARGLRAVMAPRCRANDRRTRMRPL